MVVKATRSKRIDSPTFKNKNGLEVSENYCRKCMLNKKPSEFYQATDSFLDANLLMSICKGCISKIYTDFYRSEKNMEKVILRMCRMLNVRYGEDAVNATRLQLQTQEKSEDDGTVFGIYKSKTVSTMKENVNATSLGLDLTFKEPILSNNNSVDSLIELKDNTNLDDEKIAMLRQTWGDKLKTEEYQWLEFELSKWKSTDKKIARNEETLLQLIVLKLFDIRKARNEDRDTTTLEASYQKLLDSSGLRPKDINLNEINKQDDYWGGKLLLLSIIKIKNYLLILMVYYISKILLFVV